MQLIWPLTPITRHEYTPTVDVRATDIEHLYLLQYRRFALKTMYVQFCNEAKSCAYWLVNETLWYETETRPTHFIFSPRRDRDRERFHETETFGNYVSRPSRDRDVETETTSLAEAPPISALVIGRCQILLLHHYLVLHLTTNPT